MSGGTSAAHTPVRLTALMLGAETLSMTGVATYTTLLPALMQEWQLSNTGAGAIGGFFFAGYMVTVPVLTSLTDRIDARRVYCAACVLSSLAAAGFAVFADGLWSALFFQFLLGAALGGTYMPGLKMLTDHIDGRTQSRAVAVYAAGFGLGSSVSIIVSGKIGAALGWQTAFLIAAAGPLLAAVFVLWLMPPGKVFRGAHGRVALLDFRPVLRNRKVQPYVIGYAVHNFELFGQRAWMVAFLVFCAALQPADSPMWWGPVTLAALINLLGPAASIAGNELALRHGRARVIVFFMTLSGALACVVGFAAAWPWYWVVLLMGVHYTAMLGDSAALTAGAVAGAPAHQRGAMMAAYSFTGFSAAFVAPLVFGAVLDLAGGNQSTRAWGMAFASIGILGVLAPLARRLQRTG